MSPRPILKRLSQRPELSFPFSTSTCSSSSSSSLSSSSLSTSSLSPSSFSCSTSTSSSSVLPPSRHVHFPPTPSLTSTFAAYSPATYDRSPVSVPANQCALPGRHEREFICTNNSNNNNSNGSNGSSSDNDDEDEIKGSYFHPRAYEACALEPSSSSSALLSPKGTTGNESLDGVQVQLFVRFASGSGSGGAGAESMMMPLARDQEQEGGFQVQVQVDAPSFSFMRHPIPIPMPIPMQAGTALQLNDNDGDKFKDKDKEKQRRKKGSSSSSSGSGKKGTRTMQNSIRSSYAFSVPSLDFDGCLGGF